MSTYDRSNEILFTEAISLTVPFVFCKTASLQFRAATQGAFIVPGRFPDAASVELYFTVLGERFDYQDACKGKLKEGSIEGEYNFPEIRWRYKCLLESSEEH